MMFLIDVLDYALILMLSSNLFLISIFLVDLVDVDLCLFFAFFFDVFADVEVVCFVNSAAVGSP